MRLKKITLNNIRSYQNEEIEFPAGSMLLSGDIGSGKTSVLLAIEFALFGLQPGQKGSSLLKNGENNGGVVIEFEVDGKNIIIERNLKKGKTISQDYCAITIDEEKSEIAVTELKDKVLELLSYPKEFAKKQNLLYKFTVYTPQEEMKEIVLQDSETRINTLRHVFGIDKYKKILENTGILTVKLREEKRVKQALSDSLEQDKQDLVSKESEVETKHYNVASVEKELFLKTEKRKKIHEERQEILKKIEEKTKLEQEIEKTKIGILNKKDSISNNSKMRERINHEIKELNLIAFDESKILQFEEQINRQKIEKKELNNKLLEVSSKISSLSLKNQENENTKDKLRHLELCPTCLQDVDATYKANVFNKLDYDISQNVKELEEQTLKNKSLSQEINRLEYEISQAERKIQELKILRVKFEGMKEKEMRLKEIDSLTSMLEKDIQILEGQIGTLQKYSFELRKFDSINEQKQKDLDDALREERVAEIKVAELKKEIEVFTKQIDELKKKIKKTEEIKKQADYLNELEEWLSKKFSTLISFIEKNVMVKLKHDFSNLFSEWFSMLVSETFNAKLDDDFSPIIEQQDYEIDYAYLSGGERTAVALAYRLALNQVINSLLSKIKTRDFIILDEPTDGFSSQQLDKMREVLDQLNVGQLIIVSHEQKMEGFVENIIRFKKENGVSKRV
jgi:exonuclease SbcC